MKLPSPPAPPLPLAAARGESTVAPASDDARLQAQAKAAAEKFEGFFIAKMLEQMRESAREFAPAGSAERDPVGSDMVDLGDHLVADQLAGRHAFGIADAILRQLLPAASAPAVATPLNPGAAPVASDQ